MKNNDQYAGIFWLILGTAVILSSFYYGVGSFSAPGPGFITFLAGAALAVLAVILFAASARAKERQTLRSLWEGRETGKAFYILGLLVIYMFLMTPLGFLLSTFLLLILLFRVQGGYSLKKVLMLSACSTIVSMVIFDFWLGVQLPRGFMGHVLF